MRYTLALLLALAGGLLAAPLATAARNGGPVVKTAFNAKLKKTIIVDARGMTLYDYTVDAGGTTPACVNDSTYHCSKAWPPLLTTGTPQAGKGVSQSLLGTVRRDDGTMQVTYAGHPLYGFRGYNGTPPDRKPGDLNGQAFLSIWWVLSPAGTEIHKTP